MRNNEKRPSVGDVVKVRVWWLEGDFWGELLEDDGGTIPFFVRLDNGARVWLSKESLLENYSE